MFYISGKLPENPMFPGADRLAGFGYPPMITPYPYPNGASLGPFVSIISFFSGLEPSGGHFVKQWWLLSLRGPLLFEMVICISFAVKWSLLLCVHIYPGF